MRRTVRGDHASQAIAVASFSLPAQVTPALHQVVRGNVAYKPAPKYDWTAFDALTNAEVLKAARSGPDAQPLNDAQLQGMKRPNPKVIWRALGLSQSEFRRPLGSRSARSPIGHKAVQSLT